MPKEFRRSASTSKTKIAASTKEPQQLPIRCRELLAQVDKFKYLGSIIEQKADCSCEISARMGEVSSAFRSFATIWKDRALSKPSS